MVDPKVFDSLMVKVEPLLDPRLFESLTSQTVWAIDPGLLRSLVVRAVPIIDTEALDRLTADGSWLDRAGDRRGVQDLIREDLEEGEAAGTTTEDHDRLSAVAAWFLTFGRRCARIAEHLTQTVTKTNSIIEEWRKLAVTCVALYWFLHQFLG